jgi:4-diphosphocytidyl-2-C-methyl-D-erythritol kinase
MRVRLAACAKVNLDLRILAREDTGFHQLETIFQRIALADDVEVEVQDGQGIHLRCTPPVDVPDERNLAVRAAAAYRDAAQWPDAGCAIRITLDKRIPTGGGLGGGSADAGAVLRALNALNPSPLAEPVLLSVAATLGADVPFLASEHPIALAWGRGERLLALPPLPVRAVVLATFRDGVNTAAAYGALAAARADGRVPPHGAALHTLGALHDWARLAATACNDFEPPVFALRPDVARVHAAWREAAPDALVRMSGSGATVFALGSASGAAAVQSVAAAWHDIAVVRTATLDAPPALTILS